MNSDYSNIEILRNIILKNAKKQRDTLIAEAKKEASDWFNSENEKLEYEIKLILKDAEKRADEISHRQLILAEKQQNSESLKLQNRLFTETLTMLHDKLIRLREQDYYCDILCGLCKEASEILHSNKLTVKLSSMDIKFVNKLDAKLKECTHEIEFSFSKEPASISGGVIVEAENNHKQVSLDWHTITEDSADNLIEQLMGIL